MSDGSVGGTISRGSDLRLFIFASALLGRRSGSEVVVLYSMTGYGEASYSSDLLQVAIELRRSTIAI